VTSTRERFSSWLFGAPLPPSAAGWRRWRLAGLVLAMIAAGTAITVLRLPDDARNVLWAEDGDFFLTAAYAHPFFENLFAPSAGYMHLIPRVSAQLVAEFVPLRWVGLGMNLCGALVWSAMALAAFVFTRGRLSIGFRWLLWLLVLLVPIGSHEVATNTANSHWFLMFGLFWAVATRHGTVSRVIFASAIAVAAMMSDPLSLVFVPFLIARLICLRSLREHAVTIAFAAAAVVQLLVVVNTERGRGDPVVDPEGLWFVYVIRVVWSTITGPGWGSALFFGLGAGVAAAIGTAVVVVLAVAIALRWRRAGLAVAALGASLAFYLAVAVLTWEIIGVPPKNVGVDVYWGGRYWVLPSLLLITAIVACVDVLLAPLRSSRHRAARAGAVVLLVVTSAALIAPGVNDYRTPGFKAGSPQMSAGLDAAVEQCRTEQPDARVELPTAPPTHYLAVTCGIVAERSP
jgi:hypothetical protein